MVLLFVLQNTQHGRKHRHRPASQLLQEIRCSWWHQSHWQGAKWEKLGKTVQRLQSHRWKERHQHWCRYRLHKSQVSLAFFVLENFLNIYYCGNNINTYNVDIWLYIYYIIRVNIYITALYWKCTQDIEKSMFTLWFRAKTSRVITYEEFQKALEDLAPKRFKGQSKEEALESIYKLIEGKEPTNIGVTVRVHFWIFFKCVNTHEYKQISNDLWRIMVSCWK